MYFRCVEFLTEDSGSNYSENDIKNLAKEQWLLNDLKDICPGSLPPNLKDKVKTVLPGRFVLQINAAVDIGNIYTFHRSCICMFNLAKQFYIDLCNIKFDNVIYYRNTSLPAIFEVAKGEYREY